MNVLLNLRTRDPSRIPCDNYEKCNCDECLIPRSIGKPCCKCGVMFEWEDIIPLGHTYDYKVACKSCYQKDLDAARRILWGITRKQR